MSSLNSTINIAYKPQHLMRMALIKDRKNVRIITFNSGYDKTKHELRMCSEPTVSIRSDIQYTDFLNTVLESCCFSMHVSKVTSP